MGHVYAGSHSFEAHGQQKPVGKKPYFSPVFIDTAAPILFYSDRWQDYCLLLFSVSCACMVGFGFEVLTALYV